MNTSLKVPRFSLAERNRRWALANRFMEEEGVDALIVYGDREGAFPASFAPDTYLLLIPSMGLETVLKAGMVFAVEPNCAIGKRVVNLGRTVIVGNDGGIELNTNATRLMRV